VVEKLIERPPLVYDKTATPEDRCSMSDASALEVYPEYGSEVKRSRRLKKFLLRFLPLHTLKQLQAEIPLIFLRLKRGLVVRQYRDSRDLLVNIAPGSQGRTGWINVDVWKAPLVNCLYDCRKNLPFSDSSVQGIFCEHFFEHIDYTEEVPYFLSECHRVLKKGGVLRLILPDAEKYLRAYCKGGWEDFIGIRPLEAGNTDSYFHCKYNTRMELINVIFRQGHEHKFAYDFETLRFLLLRYGFSEVVRQEYGAALMPEICLDQLVRATESIYVDAKK
jgi:predicted SAM-dependent methyltransferase